MRIFLTGGSGFVGQRLIRRLVGEGHEVLGLARSAASAAAVERAGARAVRGDLAELVDGRPDWSVALDAVDVVVHSAAHMEFWGPDAVFEQRNLRPTMALWDAAAAAKVPRFVLISAASVSTGSQQAAVVDERTDEGRPNIAYSRVKLATERELQARSGGPHLVILRPPFIWGPTMTTLDEIADAVRSGRFAWIDAGRHVVDFVHVDNLAQATGLALTRGSDGGVYYITDGDPQPVKSFVGDLLLTRGVEVPERSAPRAVAGPVALVMETAAKARRRRRRRP